MAIEPLGSMTAMQVQATTKVVAKSAESNTNQNDNQQDDEKNFENIKKAVDNLNKNMKNTSAIYGIHEGTNRVTIKIVDKQTKEVIKELPPEKTLDMISRVWEMAGMLVDEKR